MPTALAEWSTAKTSLRRSCRLAAVLTDHIDGRHGRRATPREFGLREYLLDHGDPVVTPRGAVGGLCGATALHLLRARSTNFVAKVRKNVERDPRHPRHILTVRESGYRLVRTVDDGLPA